MRDYVIIGGGIVGLATAMAVANKYSGASILVLEKEQDLAQHQTGRNSGVIHSGIYYKPGSLKARFAREGNRSIVEFCREHGIKHEVCGKLIVATKASELPLLDSLFQRGLDHGLAVERLGPEQVQEIEPHVRCLAGIKVPSTGIVNYREVSAKYVELIKSQGGTVQTGTRVDRLREVNGSQVIETSHGEFGAGFIINCAGLFSDRVARLGGLNPGAKIVPFRGEYYELVPERRYLVKSLVYPVPNPDFPFLGVHFTRMIDDSVHAGPNAVLAFKREGYRRTDINCADLFETLTFPGFWKLARKYYRDGMMEMVRSVSKRAFVRSLQQLVPEVTEDDLVPTHSGVRAQALMRDGKLVDDFLIVNGKNSIHVCNAPSPAATASLEIGRAVADHVPEMRPHTTVAVQSPWLRSVDARQRILLPKGLGDKDKPKTSTKQLVLPAGSCLGGIVIRKERWSFSWYGWLVVALVLLLGAVGLVHTIFPFLAVTHRVDSDVLVVEGWVHEYAIRTAISEFQSGHYQRVFTTGGPVAGMGGYTNDYNTSAGVGASRLKAAGLSPEFVQMVPSRINDRDRTYSAALALRNWFREHHAGVQSINVVTEDLHARRSRLLFQKAFGPGVNVGIISIPNPDYDSTHWWRYSEGVKEIISEGAAYIYASLFFYPADPPQEEKKAEASQPGR